MAALETHSDALASIYARSLFEMAEEKGGQEKIEEVAAELEQIMELTREDPAFVEFIRSAILPAESREKSLRNIFEGRISDITLHFLLVLNEKDRLARIGSITTAYDELLQERFGRVEVDVFTAGPVEQRQLDAIAERIRTALGKEPVLHHYTDESMIGGLRLRIGDQLIDGSIATQLRKMEQQLTRHGTAEIRARAERIFEDTP